MKQVTPGKITLNFGRSKGKSFSHGGRVFPSGLGQVCIYQWAGEFQTTQVALFTMCNRNQSRLQTPHKVGTDPCVRQGGGGNLQRNPRGNWQIAPRRQQGSTSADVHSSRELPELLSSIICAADKNRNCQREPLPPAPLWFSRPPFCAHRDTPSRCHCRNLQHYKFQTDVCNAVSESRAISNKMLEIATTFRRQWILTERHLGPKCNALSYKSNTLAARHLTILGDECSIGKLA